MAFDLKGNELKEGDTVILKGTVLKTTENSEVVKVKTADPSDRPGMQTELSVRASSLQKA